MSIKFKYEILNELFQVKPSPESVKIEESHYPPVIYEAFGGRVLLISYSGPIGLSYLDKFHTTPFAALTGEAQKIVLGLADATEISRSAIGAMVEFATGVLGRGKKLYLLEPPESLEASLKELQLSMFFQILPSQDDLIRILPDD